MSHFAKVIDGVVVDVISAEQDYIDTLEDKSLWIQTSYNTRGNVHYAPRNGPDGLPALRKNFAGIGFTYDVNLDAFIPPKPFPSWKLNQDRGLWESPVPQPTDGKKYSWDEKDLKWIDTTATK